MAPTGLAPLVRGAPRPGFQKTYALSSLSLATNSKHQTKTLNARLRATLTGLPEQRILALIENFLITCTLLSETVDGLAKETAIQGCCCSSYGKGEAQSCAE